MIRHVADRHSRKSSGYAAFRLRSQVVLNLNESMILSRLIAFLVLCCPFTFALGQTAEFDQFDSMSNRIRVAQEYVRIHPIEDTMRDMLSSLADNADLSPVEKEEFVDLMMGMYDMQPIEEDMILIMSRHFTFYELSALRDFYASEEGHAVMQKYPA